MEAIRKAGAVLRCFTATQPEHDVTALLQLIDSSIRRAHDLMVALAEIGLLSKIGRGGYQLGPMVAMLYGSLENRSALIEPVRPMMANLAGTMVKPCI